MEYNNRIDVDFTDREGRRRHDVYGIKEQACAYARLLSEMGYHVHELIDLNSNETLDWRQNTDNGD